MEEKLFLLVFSPLNECQCFSSLQYLLRDSDSDLATWLSGQLSSLGPSPLDRHVLLVRLMVRLGLDRRALQSYPPALLLPLYKAMHAVRITRGRREGSGFALSPDENELIGEIIKVRSHVMFD